jgi:hypothetical protein
MPCGEMTVTLDDVHNFLYLPIQGRLLDHKGIPTKAGGVEMMMEFLGSTNNEAESEVKMTKGAHVRFIYLKGLITKHLKSMKEAHVKKISPLLKGIRNTCLGHIFYFLLKPLSSPTRQRTTLI